MHPVLFEIGPFTIRTYGVMLAIAFGVGFSLMYREAKRKCFYPDKILDLQMCIVVFGILGARLFHVLLHFGAYRNSPLEIFMLWKGGLAFQGGLFLAFLSCWIYVRKQKLPLFKLADFMIPYIALGHSIGRIGCYFNGCCFGNSAAFPTQILSSLGLLFIFIVLKMLEKKKPFDGFIIGAYFVLYATMRFFVDFLRADLTPCAMGFTVSQFISGGFFLLGILIFIMGRKNAKL